MKDILFGNNNNQIVKKLSMRSFKQNIKQNKVMIVSIALVSFMVFTVFSVGMSFYQNYSSMSLHVTGTKANGLLPELTYEQSQALKQLDYIETVGEQIFTGHLRTNDGDNLVFTYYDADEWDNHIQGTIEKVTGNLPQKENEIMLSSDAMEALGITNAALGMDVPLTIQTNGHEEIVRFKLCGWYHDYVGVSRPVGSMSGNVAAAGLAEIQADANAIVSMPFAEKHSVYGVTTFVSDGDILDLEKKLQTDLKLAEEQSIILINFQSRNAESGLYTMIGVLLGSLFIMLCGYLLIYNIAYISVTKDIRFYGMLKALGTTSHQLKKLVGRQIMLLSCMGIPIGLIVGSVISIVAVPMLLDAILATGGFSALMSSKASFHPLIYVGTTLFSFITVLLSCYKPAQEAGKVSPIVAIKYTGVTIRNEKPLFNRHKKKLGLGFMAFRNVFRDRKKVLLVFFSLFMGLTVFLSIFTLFSNPNWEYSAAMDAPYDFELSNAVIKDGASCSLFDDDFLEKINSMHGITEQEIVYGIGAELSLSDTAWQDYILDKLQVSSVEEYELKSGLRADTAGISANLLQTMPLSDGVYDEINIADFEAGKTVYLSPTENNKVPDGLVGQTIQIKHPTSEQVATYTIAGVLNPLTIKEWKKGENFNHNIGGIRDNQAVSDYGKHRIARIYMSVAGISRMSENPIINQILLNVEPNIESTIKQQLMDVQGKNSDMYLLTQSTYIETNKMSMGSIMIIGTVLSLLLLLIGLLNFINTMTTTIYSRQLELATLESIGMTKKQLFKMLSFEGSTYAVFSIALLTVLGVPLTYGLIELVREEFYFLTFKPPILAIVLVSVLVFAICWIVPQLTFKRICEKNVTERLKAE